MKALILISGFLVSAYASAEQDLLDLQNPVMGYRYQACPNWVYSSVPSPGFPGFVCASGPQAVFVASADSVKRVVSELESRIKALEQRIRILEAR